MVEHDLNTLVQVIFNADQGANSNNITGKSLDWLLPVIDEECTSDRDNAYNDGNDEIAVVPNGVSFPIGRGLVWCRFIHAV